MSGFSPRAHARIFLLAGEPSGDMLGGRLIQALRAEGGDSLELFGVGGARMREQGLKSLFPMDELSLFGIAEVVPHLPRLARRLRQTVHEVARRRPDLVLTIDAPGFALRLQHRLTRLPLLRVHYVAPQVWAWRASRAARLTRDLDHLLALLPFEPAYFERHGLPCSFVGHPIVAHDRLEGGDVLHPAGRVQVVQDRLVAGEALEAHDLLGQERPVLPELDVALAWEAAEALVGGHG